MTNILLSGANGNMGRAVTRTVENNDKVKITAGYDINTVKNSDFPVYDNLDEVKEPFDVIIDFSHPSVFDSILEFSVKTKTPAVICTTGLSGEQISKMKAASKKAPIFFSANMSLGVNLLIDLVCKAAKLLDGSFDIEIIEKHHNQKADSPSGTALMLADVCDPYHERERKCGRKGEEKRKNEIGIHSVRGGTIFGEHTVIFALKDEVIEIKHTAFSKKIFAKGALEAALWLKEKKPGFYPIEDVFY